MKRKDVTSLVQRVEAFEARFGVRIQGLSAFETKEHYSADHNLIVCGEIHSVNGSELARDIEIQIAVLDEKGRVITTETEYLDAEKFFSFHTFEIHCAIPPKMLARVRIVPSAT